MLNEDFSKDKEMLDFSNYLSKSKYDNDSCKFGVGKMKAETSDVAIKEFVVLKPKMCLFLVDDNSEDNINKACE